MNELINLIIEEQETLEQLIAIDNNIMNRSIHYQDFLNQSIKIINQNIKITNDTNKKRLLITDGDPLLTLAILNSQINQDTTIFINHHYVALNKWLITRYNQLTNDINYHIDFSINYNHYIKNKKEYEIIQAGEYDQIEKTINPVLESQAEIAVYDLLPLNDDPLEIVEVIDSIQQSRGGKKIIFLAAGMGKNTPVIDALRKAGYVNFVLDSTYGAKKEKFARCLTNFYESNADRLDRELSDTELPRELHFTAFAGAQTRIGTTTQAIQYAGYLADCGKRVCYVEETGDFFPQKLFETYQYAAESGDCITYAGIPMYTGKTMQEMLKMNYEHFVLYFGSIEREQFAASLFFDERMQRVIVAGTKPQEWTHTKYVLANALCKDAAYILSFADISDVEAVSGAFFQMPLFAGYIPDMFARDQEDLALGYRRLFPEEETKRKKENRKKKSAHKRTRRAL